MEFNLSYHYKEAVLFTIDPLLWYLKSSSLINKSTEAPGDITDDKRFYKHGAVKLFYTAHHAVHPLLEWFVNIGAFIARIGPIICNYGKEPTKKYSIGNV